MNKTEVTEIVTENILACLEAGTAPWRKPWSAAGIDYPTSLSTGKAYRGINVLILDSVAIRHGYAHNLWATFNQVKAMGGKVTKGEKATPIVLWKPCESEDADGNKKTFMLMRYFNVFNIAQTDLEVPAKYLVERTPVSVADGVLAALNYPGGPNVTYRHQDRAFYQPLTDTITLPVLEQFESASAFAETALHEAAHSTGHSSRLARLEDGARFGCDSYAQEELVAEIGAAMIASRIGIEVEWSQHAAYCASWLKVLKDDRSLIVSAAQAAQKAADVVLAEALAEEVAA